MAKNNRDFVANQIMKKPGNNYAFIDSQNLNLGIQKLGWKLDYRKFRVYLKEKYNIQKKKHRLRTEP